MEKQLQTNNTDATYPNMIVAKKGTDILNQIEEAHQRMLNNEQYKGKGVIFIRKTTKDYDVITRDESVKTNFNVVTLKTYKGSIDYDYLITNIKLMLISEPLDDADAKPIIFFFRGDFQSVTTIDQRFKNYIYLAN